MERAFSYLQVSQEVWRGPLVIYRCHKKYGEGLIYLQVAQDVWRGPLVIYRCHKKYGEGL